MLTTLAAASSIAPVPVPEAHPAPRQPSAHPFAELLRQNQRPVDTSQRAAKTPSENSDATPTTDTTPGADATLKSPQAQRARVRSVAPETTHPRPLPGAREDKAEAAPADAKPTEPAAPTDANAADPGLAQWLANLHAGAAAKTPVDAADRTAGTADDPAAGASDALAKGRAGRADASSGTDPRRSAADLKAKQELGGFDAAMQAQRDRSDGVATKGAEELRGAETAASRIEPSLNASALTGAGFNPSSTSVDATAAPVDVNLATPFATPEFAAALGVQVSVLARDGVQRAELHLNPADMGPVSVQIVVDGTQARVDFGADLATTRQAIEAGLPELASALRDAGLTLHGGGVSQHSSGRGEGGGDASSGSAPNGLRMNADDAALRPVRLRAAVAGGVDLYA